MPMTRTRNGTGKPTQAPLLLLAGGVFLASRLLVLPFPQPASDVGIYARYAQEHEAASRTGVSFYEFHAQKVEREAKEADVAGTLAAPIDEYKDVEYPPLALVVMRLPALGMRGEVVDAGPQDSIAKPRYYFTFHAGMAVVDGALLVLVVVLCRRLFPSTRGEGTQAPSASAGTRQAPSASAGTSHRWRSGLVSNRPASSIPDESKGDQGQRLLVYAASTMLLWHLLYDRLDLVLAALVLLSLALLASRAHYSWSFALLAVAIHFKLVPVVLAPIWVVGAMPGSQPLEMWRPRALAGFAARGSLLLGLVVVGFVPFYLWTGEHCLDFFRYHRARPIEIDSLYGSLVLVLRSLGHPVTVDYSYGSINVHSPLTPALVALSPWLTAGALVGAIVVLLRFRRVSGAAGVDSPAGATLARAHPRPFISFTLLFLMLFIATNKVFSPQYLLWLAPLVALLPLGRGSRRLFTTGFLLVCALSTVLVPFLFTFDLIDPEAPRRVPRAIREPTVRLAVVLVVRNLLFLALIMGLAVHLVRGGGAAPRAEAG
ncbi:MAG: hypothetical protein HYS12_08285 [Planctomycetes bacterium]|nr:hypothetical protein [Planctomycetota bacterium]